MTKSMLILIVAALCLLGCSKTDNDKVEVEGQLFYKVDKIIGPIFHDDISHAVINTDSSLYRYDDDQRISKIVYFTSYIPAPGNVTAKLTYEENFMYDSKGRVIEIRCNAPSSFRLEKRVTFYYNSLDELVEAHLVLNTRSDESDSIVLNYRYSHAPFPTPVVINNESIVKDIICTRTNYTRGFEIQYQFYPQAYQWKLNKNNISIETKIQDSYSSTLGFTEQVVVEDSTIVQYNKRATTPTYPVFSRKYTRSELPSVPFQISKNIFRNNTWLSNIGSFSPYHPDFVSHFITKSEDVNSVFKTLIHDYAIDSVNNRITEDLRDGNRSPLLKTTYYFNN